MQFHFYLGYVLQFLRNLLFQELTSDDGAAFATSEFTRHGDYKAANAFKIQGATDNTYWCSKQRVKVPIYLWFQFIEPKCVTKIQFETKDQLDAGQVYKVRKFLSSEKINNSMNNIDHKL